MEHIASSEIECLGLVFSTSPPDPLVIKGVGQGSWAQEQGISEGDMVVAVNGIAIEELTDSQFRSALEDRPIAFVIDSLLSELEAGSSPSPISSPSGLSKRSCSTNFQDADLWWSSERESGEALDDSTCASTVASLSLEPMECKIGDELPKDGEAAEQSDDDAERDQDAASLRKEDAFELRAGTDVVRLGLSFSNLPPDPLVIKRVSNGSWAEAQSIEAGDMVIAVNGIDVQEFTADEFRIVMMERPLSMHIDSLAVKPRASFFRRPTLFDTDFLPFLALDILKSVEECQILW
jgi:hypothetical protein